MLGAIARVMRKLDPLTTKLIEEFIKIMKQLECTSVTAILAAEDNASYWRCAIYFYDMPTWPQVVCYKELLWSKEIIGTKEKLSERLRGVAETELEKIKKEIPGIRVEIIDRIAIAEQ